MAEQNFRRWFLGDLESTITPDCQHSDFCFNKFIYYLFILLLVALGLHCCTQAFSSCSEWGLLFVVVRGLLIAVASLVEEHGL